MRQLRIAEKPELPRTLREVAANHTDERSIDYFLRRQLGSRIHFLSSEQLFGFNQPEDEVAERLVDLTGHETVRYIGLRAITATRAIDPRRIGPAVVEDDQLTVAVFKSGLMGLGRAKKLMTETESTTVAGLFPVIGVELDEPISLDSLATMPAMVERPPFRPTLIR